MLTFVIKSLTNTANEHLSQRDRSEREQAWLDLLLANKLRNYEPAPMLRKAITAKCYRIAEYLYEREHNYSAILGCYLNDPVRKSDVFNYILNYVNVPERCVREQFLVNFIDLVQLNSKRTGEIVLEHFPDLIEQFSEILAVNGDLQYAFLSEIITVSSSCDNNISNNSIKLPAHLAEQYLELLCSRHSHDGPLVCNYIQLNLTLCRIDRALEITRKYAVHAATALLLERGGEWRDALELLLQHDMIDEAVCLCVRAVEHLDVDRAQSLWLCLLEHRKSMQTTTTRMSLRQLLHAAAPHVPPDRLLELVSNASFGDIKGLLHGILTDYTHDVQMLSTTLNLLSRDLHHGK